MKYDSKVIQRGQSYSVTIPSELLKEAGISFAERLQLELKDGKIVISKKREATLHDGVRPDFFEPLERSTKKNDQTLKKLT